MGVALGLVLGPAIGLGACRSPGPTDTAEFPRGRLGVDRHPGDGGAVGTADDPYVHLARRGLVTLGLAEARRIDTLEARAWVDALADKFQDCADRLAKEGRLSEGAMRLVMVFDGAGTPRGDTIRHSPGAATLATGLLCLVGPARTITISPAKDVEQRGFAVEAHWGASPM
jgi:hypothetical protein